MAKLCEPAVAGSDSTCHDAYTTSEFVTPAYYGTLFNITGKVNDASFNGLAASESLFLGASGSKRGGSRCGSYS